MIPVFFTQSLADRDPELSGSITSEPGRQRDEIELIASGNIVSAAVMEAQGLVMTNKYAEGYPDRRYYGGCQYVDVAENLAIDRARQLFNRSFANVQPNSGSQANQGVFQALIKPGDSHVVLVDLRPKGVKGNATEKGLGRAHITCNKNGVPFDPEKPTITSGIRPGSPAGTTGGFGETGFRQIADWIIKVVDGLAANGEDGNGDVEAKVKAKVAEPERVGFDGISIDCRENRTDYRAAAINSNQYRNLFI